MNYGNIRTKINKRSFVYLSINLKIKVMNKDKIIDVIITLLDEIEVTGEQMEFILNEVGMEYQMLRQLIMSASLEDIEELVNEKKIIQSTWE